MKSNEQALQERRERRQAKANGAELASLRERNPRNKAVNDAMREAGTSISVELSYCRKSLNAVCEALGIDKPAELERWNAIAEAAKSAAE
mgnify:CR=1 FL=1